MSEQIWLRIRIDNVYPGETVTRMHNVSCALTSVNPNELPVSEDFQEWAEEHLFALTGTGRTGDDSKSAGYFAKIVDASEKARWMIGMEFEWGV